MKLKWGSEEIDNFRMPKVERINWLTKLIDDYFMWFVMAIMAGATIWIFVKIYQLSLIHFWLKSI